MIGHQILIKQQNIDVKSKAMPSRSGKRNRGAAMIVVVCVMAVVMILSLTLLMAAYQMLATVNDEGRDELYYQQAMSFSEVLKARLEKSNSVEESSLDELTAHINDFMRDSTRNTEELTAAAPGGDGVYGGMKLNFDKKVSHGNLVIKIDINEGDKSMASCTCKFEVKDEAGRLKYTFKGYY